MFSLSASAYGHLSRFKSFKCGVKIPIAKAIGSSLLQIESPNVQRLRRNTEKRFEYQILFAHGYSKAMPAYLASGRAHSTNARAAGERSS